MSLSWRINHPIYNFQATTNKSMSQDLDHHHHHSIFSYQEQQDHDHHIAQQIRREKLRLHGFHQPAPPLVAGTHDRDQSPVAYREPTGMLAEMFNFPPPAPTAGAGPTASLFQAAADSMQLFLMNPSAAAQTRSPPSADPNSAASMLLPNPNNHGGYEIQGFATAPAPAFVEGQGLSLSLSSNVLHHLYTNNQLAPPPVPATTAGEASNAVHMAYGSSIGMVNVLRNSKYLNAARELLEEFCSVWRSGRFENKEAKEVAGQTYGRSNPNNNGASSCSNNNSSSISKDSAPPLSSANRMEHQRRKVKLLAMLDEVEGRYKHYCEQMQMVVNSFDLVMGMGAAAPYTALAQKAMSRHFRCLKDAIEAQLKHSCELLGENGGRNCGITKGETPRLKLLDHTLRQQRSFHQMDHDAWRPQRGLPDRSVTVLRAWLFEHFLHPYPSDADKHLLARQTGLSRNQVSNWFINARVRLWKPMVEEMYQQEAKEDDSNDDVVYSNNNQQEEERESSRNPSNSGSSSSTSPHNRQQHEAQTPTPRRCPNYNINNNAVSESDASLIFSGNGHPPPCSGVNRQLQVMEEEMYTAGCNNIEFGAVGEFVRVDRRPPTSGDVSLTLGLRHAGAHNSNATSFSFTDFGAS